MTNREKAHELRNNTAGKLNLVKKVLGEIYSEIENSPDGIFKATYSLRRLLLEPFQQFDPVEVILRELKSNGLVATAHETREIGGCVQTITLDVLWSDHLKNTPQNITANEVRESFFSWPDGVIDKIELYCNDIMKKIIEAAKFNLSLDYVVYFDPAYETRINNMIVRYIAKYLEMNQYRCKIDRITYCPSSIIKIDWS